MKISSAVAALVFAFIVQSFAVVETKAGNYLLAEAERRKDHNQDKGRQRM